MSERPKVTIRSTPDDFVVDELPAYEPSGQGDHLYVHFRKRGLTTFDAVKRLASALGVPSNDAGTAGLKDKWAVTTQWASFPFPIKRELPAIESLSGDGLTVLRAERHSNKLKTGHLRGNAFDLVLRDVRPGDVAAILEGFARIAVEGLPNWYGEQRFGFGGQNAERAKRWMLGQGKPPRDPKAKRLELSAWQSALFHEVLERRIADGTWRLPLAGDLCVKLASGGLFPCTDPEGDRARAEAKEIAPTGPMFGAKMREPEGDPGRIERDVLAASGIDHGVLAAHARIAEGTRRSLVLYPENLHAAVHPNATEMQESAGATAVRVRFVLPKGAYATTVVGAVADAHPPSAPLAEARPDVYEDSP